MALLKAFVCQLVLFGLYKLFLEQVVVDHLVPDELTRNCLVGFVIFICFGIQLYTEKVEEQAEAAKAKSRRRTSSNAAEKVSEYLDERTVHMMKTLDAAMQHMNQMPMSEGYVQHVVFAAAGSEVPASEQTFSKQPDAVVIEEIYSTKLDDVKSNVSANEPIVVPHKMEEVREEKRSDKTESEEEDEEEEVEETEAKSDVCEEEEEDVVTVIDASKPKPVLVESEEEEEEEEEEEKEEEEEEEEEKEQEKETAPSDNKKNMKVEEKPNVKQSKVEEEEEEEEEEESEEEEIEVKKETGKVTKTS